MKVRAKSYRIVVILSTVASICDDKISFELLELSELLGYSCWLVWLSRTEEKALTPSWKNEQRSCFLSK
jgi:hypothetical protein